MDATPNDKIGFMRAAALVTSDREWGTLCDSVKAHHNGYPEWWFETVVQSGMAAEIFRRWNGDPGIKIIKEAA